jgi:hexosaminidase
MGLGTAAFSFDAGASFSYWDPNGTAGGTASGTWENANWSTRSGGSQTPSAFTEGYGANFAVGASSSTPALTVTMNSNHSVAGVFDGNATSPVNVTISGSGTMTMPSGTQQGFYINSDSLIINVPIAGSAQLVAEDNGQLYLNAVNTYSSGTSLGFSGTPFTGSIFFNNSSSFGTGTITMTSGSGASLMAEGSGAITIANAFSLANWTLNLSGTPGGVTFSGPWAMGSSGAATLAFGGLTNLVTISGTMTGGVGFVKSGAGTLALTGNNTYGSGTTQVSGGSLLLANTTGSATGSTALTVASGALLSGSGSASGTVDNSGILSATNLTGGTAALTTGSQTWEAGSVYQWAVNNVTGTAGAASGWDKLSVNGSLTVAASSGAPMTVKITSLTSANQQGAMAAFDNTRDYDWLALHSSSGSIAGFSTSSVLVNTSAFGNSLGAGVFEVSTNITGGGDLYVGFVHTPVLILTNTTATENSNAVLYASNSVTGSAPGTAAYSWQSNGVALSDGGRISGSATPTLTIANAQFSDNATYTAIAVNAAGSNSVSATLAVNATATSVTWANPAPIYYGTALGSSQLDASANVPGTFVYSPVSGTALNSGTHTLSTIFTPADQVDFAKATNTVTLTVLAEPLTVAGNNAVRPAGAANPAFTGTITGVTNGDNITATYSSSAIAGSPVGAYSIVPTLVDPGNRLTNYAVTAINGTLDVGTMVTWANPASIPYGTALSAAQLNATGDVAGNMVYSPGLGTVPGGIGTYTLSAVFTPYDSADYPPVTKTVSLTVTPAALTVAAANVTRQQGVANPVLSGTITGATNGDNITASFNTTATSASPVGTYPIIPALVDPNDAETNYSVSLINGALTVTAPAPPVTVSAPSIIPLPVTMQTRPGIFALCPSQPATPAPGFALMTILVDSASQQTGQYLQTALAKSTGYIFPIVPSSAANAVKNAILITTANAIGTLGAEGYELTVAPDSVVIRAPQQGGTFYGVQSLLQLLPPQIYSPTLVTNVAWVAPCVYIEDYPLYSWRGVMLDPARHFINKDEVKRIIDAMAMHKLNTLHLHLVDDQGWRLEITNYPNLNSIGSWRNGIDYGLAPRSTTATNSAGQYGGYYTQNDAREMVAYAAERHITIVPEIEMPCHSDAGLASYGQFSTGKSGQYTMDYYGIQSLYGIDLYSLGTPGTMDFLEDAVAETISVFPSKYIHCGGDEVVSSGDTHWNSYNADVTNMEAQGIAPNGTSSIIAYQHWFSTVMSSFIQSKGRMMMGWSEYEAGGVVPNAACMDWETGSSSEAVAVAEAGLPVVMCPDTTCYVNYVEGTSASLPIEPGFAVGGVPQYCSLANVYAYNPMPSALPSQYATNILGAQCTLFAEYVPSFENVMFKLFPRETAMAEITWTPRAQQSFSSFTNRLATEEQRFQQMGLNYNHESVPAIGNWANVSTGGSTLTLNATPNITAAGEVDVSFWYLSGSPLAISSVSLLVNGTQVDIDSHAGTAESTSSYEATEPFIPIYAVYVLHLPELVPGATYTIKAQVAGSGGTATSGTIYMPNWN